MGAPLGINKIVQEQYGLSNEDSAKVALVLLNKWECLVDEGREEVADELFSDFKDSMSLKELKQKYSLYIPPEIMSKTID